MNEITIITLTWWQLGLFTIIVSLEAVCIYAYLPILFKRLEKFAKRLEGK